MNVQTTEGRRTTVYAVKLDASNPDGSAQARHASRCVVRAVKENYAKGNQAHCDISDRGIGRRRRVVVYEQQTQATTELKAPARLRRRRFTSGPRRQGASCK